MPDTGEALKIWQALRPMVDKEIAEQTESCVRAKKMIVKQATVQNEDGSVSLGVAEPYNDKVMIPSGDELSDVNPGSPVWVYWYFNNASTMHVAFKGDGTRGNSLIDRLTELLNKEIADREKADQDLYDHFTDEDNKLYAYIDKTASHLRIEFDDGLNSLRSYVELTSSKLRLEFTDELNSLRSYVEITASHLRTEFYDDINSLRSYVEITASHLRTEFYDELNSLRSYVEITASHLRTEFYDDLNSLRSYVEITASHLRTEFYDDLNSLRSYVEITASHLRTEFYDDMNSLRSYVEITASHLRTEFYDDVNSLRSYVEITASHLRTEFYDDISSLRSYVEITASHLRAEYYDDMNSMRSYVELTASHLRTEFYDDMNSLRSYVEITASHLSAEFYDDINSLRSYVEVQAGKIDMNVAATDENSSILRQAGMYINDQGVLIYATDNQNNIGSKLNVLSGEISAKVGKSEVVITDNSVTIGSQSISFVGYVTAENISTYFLAGDDATFGYLEASTLDVDSINVQGSISTDYINGHDPDAAIATLGPATSSGGQITIPYTTLGGTSGSVNFNIADTQFYQDGVAAAAATVDFNTESLWNSGDKTLTLTNGKTHTVSIPNASSWSSAKISSKSYAVTALVGGKALNTTIDTTGSYDDGYAAGAATGTTRTATSAGSVTLTSSDTGSAVSKTVTVTYDNSTTTPDVPVTIDASSVYSAGIANEAAKYTAVTVIPCGTSVTPTRRAGYYRGSQITGTNQGVQVTVTLYLANGNEYPFTVYREGNSYTHYAGGDAFEYYDVGDSTTLYEAGTAMACYTKSS